MRSFVGADGDGDAACRAAGPLPGGGPADAGPLGRRRPALDAGSGRVDVEQQPRVGEADGLGVDRPREQFGEAGPAESSASVPATDASTSGSAGVSVRRCANSRLTTPRVSMARFAATRAGRRVVGYVAMTVHSAATAACSSASRLSRPAWPAAMRMALPSMSCSTVRPASASPACASRSSAMRTASALPLATRAPPAAAVATAASTSARRRQPARAGSAAAQRATASGCPSARSRSHSSLSRPATPVPVCRRAPVIVTLMRPRLGGGSCPRPCPHGPDQQGNGCPDEVRAVRPGRAG